MTTTTPVAKKRDYSLLITLAVILIIIFLCSAGIVNAKDQESLQATASQELEGKTLVLTGTNQSEYVDLSIIPVDFSISGFWPLGYELTATGQLSVHPKKGCQISYLEAGANYIKIDCINQPTWEITDIHGTYPPGSKFSGLQVNVFIEGTPQVVP